MENDLVKINPEEIAYIFYVDDKKYAALYDSEDEDHVYFALISKLDDERDVYTHVPEEDLEKVSVEFEKFLDFFEEEDELDGEDSE